MSKARPLPIFCYLFRASGCGKLNLTSSPLWHLFSRNLLKKIVSEMRESGMEPYCGPEFEFYTFKESSHSLNEKAFLKPEPFTPGMFGYSAIRTGQYSEIYDDIFDQME